MMNSYFYAECTYSPRVDCKNSFSMFKLFYSEGDKFWTKPQWTMGNCWVQIGVNGSNCWRICNTVFFLFLTLIKRLYHFLSFKKYVASEHNLARNCIFNKNVFGVAVQLYINIIKDMCSQIHVCQSWLPLSLSVSPLLSPLFYCLVILSVLQAYPGNLAGF